MSSTTSSTQTRKSRATVAADKAKQDNVTPISSAGRSVTGDNGGGRKRKAQAPASEPKTVKPSKTPKAPTATAGVQPFDRHRGLAVTGDQQEQATGPNGAITSEAAMAAAEKLARKLGEGWTATVQTFDRFMATVTPLQPEGAETIVCTCKYGHRDEDAAHSCAVRLAHSLKLSI